MHANRVERMVILGCAGAGKSMLAERVSRLIGVPAVHLDVLFYRRGWTPAPKDEALADLRAALARDCWILDGNFLSARDARFQRAQCVVFLDRSRATCLWRVLKRRLLAIGGFTRPDLPQGCAEGLDVNLLRWVWRYPRVERPLVVELLGKLANDVAIHHLRSNHELERFLAALPRRPELSELRSGLTEV